MKPNDLFKESAVSRELARAKEGNEEANIRLGYRYFTGLGMVKDYNRSLKCFEAAAPDPMASAWFAFITLLDPNLWKKPGLRGKCYDTLQQLVQWGDPVGQTMMGLIFERGRANFMRDRPRAKELYHAAVGSFALAGTHLGEMYLRERKYDDAIKLFSDAAKEGETGSMVNLAELYLQKRIPPVQVLEARLLLRTAAERGDVRAQYRLAVLYHRDSLKREGADAADHRSMKHKYAFKLFDRCAMRGYPPAFAALALCHDHGLGTARDGKKSNAWLQFATKDIDRVATELGLPAPKKTIPVEKNPNEVK